MGNVTASLAYRVLKNKWTNAYFRPSVIRVDEDGALTGDDFVKPLDGLNFKVEVTSGESPWQMG